MSRDSNLSVVKQLPSKCVQVSINQVIDASTFWVLESSSSNDVKRIEDFLFKEFNLQREGCNFLPEEMEMVSVKDRDSGRCYRGIVKNVLQTAKGYKYETFLVDHGISLTVSSSYIRVIPPSMLRKKWNAYQIEIYGIVPTSVSMNFEKDRFERIVTSEWTEAAINFVNTTIKRHQTGYFLPRLGFGENKQFGELYLHEMNGHANLGNLLVEMEYAVWEETLFKELADAEYAYIKHNGYRNWLLSDVQSHLDSSLIQKKWSIIENYVKQCSQVNQTQENNNKRRQIEEWRENGRRALENYHLAYKKAERTAHIKTNF